MAAKKEKKETKPTRVKVEICAHNIAGKYGLPYNYGQKVELEAKQAKELLDAGDAKEVK
jgi:hypothetical protein